MMETNKIYLGDANELIRSVADNSVDLIMTDPPYLISGFHKASGVLDGRQRSFASEILNQGIYNGFDLSILKEFVRVMKRINIYLWCNKEQIYDYLTFFAKERDCNWEMIVWAKTNPPPFFSTHYLKDKEYCLYFWENGVKLHPSFETGRTFYSSSTNTADKSEYLHPTIKPLTVIENLIKNSTEEGQVVLDPFIGSGTTAVACKHTKRKYLGFEIDGNYFKIATDRVMGWNQKGQMNLIDFDGGED